MGDKNKATKKVVIGGTFDVLHRGHHRLLKKAFKLGRVTIGLTSNTLAEKIRKREINDYNLRKKELEKFIRKNFSRNARIIKIEDKFGPTLRENFDYIVVSPETLPTARLINKKRRERNKKPIEIVKIKFVLDKNGKPVSATRIIEDIRKKKRPVLAVDGLIVEKGKVLMEKRRIKPFSGYWELIGGHVEYGEKAEEAMKREAKEELGVPVKIKKLFGIYSNPKRDPRYHTISIVYLLERGKGELKLSFEASEFNFFPLNNLPRKIGFDHREIINDFKKSGSKKT